jgi:UDP-N-acetylmuramate: L-alanyl-gamma-D-glutamyl-meso-diaminopimelate ligase
MVYFDPKNVQAKKLDPIAQDDIKKAFGSDSIKIFTDPDELREYLTKQSWMNKNLLLMSSGNFGGLSVNELAGSLND